MSKGRTLFFVCVALVFVVGFLSGIIVGPLIMRPAFGHMMGMKRDRGMPMDFGMLPGLGPEKGGPGGPHGVPGGPRLMDGKGRVEEDIKEHIVDGMRFKMELIIIFITDFIFPDRFCIIT